MPPKKILIVDEDGFSKICSAMLSDEGYQTELALSEKDAIRYISSDSISLIISSYPYGMSLLRTLKAKDIPIIILSDEINSVLIEIMKAFKYSVCMVKPLDFQRFRYLVRGIMNGYLNLTGGNIIA
jgi:DNA-binding response OmpR family regulator